MTMFSDIYKHQLRSYSLSSIMGIHMEHQSMVIAFNVGFLISVNGPMPYDQVQIIAPYQNECFS